MTTSADSFGRRKIQRIIGTIPTADLPRAIFLFLRLALTETLLYSLPSWRCPGRGEGGLPERVPLSRGERLSATMSAAADAGTMKAVRSERKCVDTWPVSHGTRAPPKPAPENTQPLLRQPSNTGEAKVKISGKSGASPRPVTEAPIKT